MCVHRLGARTSPATFGLRILHRVRLCRWRTGDTEKTMSDWATWEDAYLRKWRKEMSKEQEPVAFKGLGKIMTDEEVAAMKPTPVSVAQERAEQAALRGRADNIPVKARTERAQPAPATADSDYLKALEQWRQSGSKLVFSEWLEANKPAPATAGEWMVVTPSGIWQGDKFLAYARNKRDAVKIVDAHKAAIDAAYEKGKQDALKDPTLP
jgi:hypothetical protein